MQEQAQAEDELARGLPLDTLIEAVSCCLDVLATGGQP
jgi:hypothetical protein